MEGFPQFLSLRLSLPNFLLCAPFHLMKGGLPGRKKACISITWQIRNCCFSFAGLFDVYGNCLWNLCNLTSANKRGHHGRLLFIYKNCRKWKAAAIIKGLWMSRIWNTTFIIIRFLQSHLPWPYFKNLTKFPQSHSLYFNKYFLN